MSEAAQTFSFDWPADVRCSSPTVSVLVDKRHRYQDAVWLDDGSVFKLTGDWHPAQGLLGEPDWGPRLDVENRRGMAKIRQYRWPNGDPVAPRFEVVSVPLYGRLAEVIPPARIESFILPEDMARSVADAPSSAGEELFVALLDDLYTKVGLPDGSVGLNGSYSRGLGIDASDLDIDIYGSDAIALMRAQIPALLTEGGDWSRRWPPDPQTNLFYMHKSSYADYSLEKLWEQFMESGRDIFNFFFRGKKVSFFYHSDVRGSPRDDIEIGFSQLGAAERYTGVFAEENGSSHLDMPAFVTFTDVRETDSGAAIGDQRVVSWAKGFYYCRAGDVLNFSARRPIDDAAQVLVIPDFGSSWPVRITRFV